MYGFYDYWYGKTFSLRFEESIFLKYRSFFTFFSFLFFFDVNDDDDENEINKRCIFRNFTVGLCVYRVKADVRSPVDFVIRERNP